MTRTIKQINNDLAKIKKTNETKIKELEKDLLTLEPAIEQVKNRIIEAKKNIDKESYDSAKNELWTLENTKELLTDKLTELRHNPLINKETYQSLYYEIVEVADKKIKETTKKLAVFFPDLETINKEYYDTLILVSETLEILQNEIGKNAEEFKKDANGYIDSNFYSGLRYQAKHNPAHLVENFVNQYKEMMAK
ncbi:hypothetical protein MKL29_03515 [Streptococcus suis]|nr:hypothetical protein [Streptococcus suis]